MAGYESSVKHNRHSAVLPFLELIAGIRLMVWLNGARGVAQLIFPITLIGPRILTPKAVQANYEPKVTKPRSSRGAGERRGADGGESRRLSARRSAVTFRNNASRRSMAEATFFRPWWAPRHRLGALLHLIVLAIGA